MKFIGSEFGRVVISFHSEEIRPERGISLKDGIAGISERYQFLNPPKLSDAVEKIEKEGYKFKHGTFRMKGEEVSLSELSIFKDGISITANRTEQAEYFWNDFFQWAQEFLGLRDFIRTPTIFYLSQVHVIFDRNIENLFSAHKALLSCVKEHMSADTGKDDPVFLNRVDFGYDPDIISGLRPARFLLERRAGVSFQTNRYFSEGPFSTQNHIELLEKIETFAD